MWFGCKFPIQVSKPTTYDSSKDHAMKLETQIWDQLGGKKRENKENENAKTKILGYVCSEA